MAMEDFGLNVRRVMTVNKLSIKQLSEKTSLGTATISNILNGKSHPNSTTLISISNALNVSIEKLIEDVPEVRTLRFRTNKKLSAVEKAKRDDIKVETAIWMHHYSELEDLLKDRKESPLVGIKEKDPVAAAKLARQMLGYNAYEPIYDLNTRLESKGVKILLQPFGLQKTFGLSANEDDIGMAIVVNDDESISVERKTFTMAHELGHLLLHSNSYCSNEEADVETEEIEANTFASEFLMPQEAFLKRWNDYNASSWVDAVLSTKSYFQVSYRTVLMRLSECIKSCEREDLFSQFCKQYKIKYHHDLKNGYEPGALATYELKAKRFDKLVRIAYEKGEISSSYAANILKLSLEDFRERVAEWKLQSAMLTS